MDYLPTEFIPSDSGDKIWTIMKVQHGVHLIPPAANLRHLQSLVPELAFPLTVLAQ